MQVPFNDLSRAYRDKDPIFEQTIAKVCSSGRYVLGENVTQFEEAFATYVNAPYCIGVANGSDALVLGLRALGVQSGDRVATCANAAMYSTLAITHCGAEPLFVDVDPTTHTMYVEAFAAIAHQVKAVVVTHLYGQMADVEAICTIAKQNGVEVLEDCAQAHGAARQRENLKQFAGTFGAIGTYSFYPTKNLGALGDGGALVCNDPDISERLRSLRQYGWNKKYSVETRFGVNSRLDELQAAVLLYRLPKLDTMNEARRKIVQKYRSAIKHPFIKSDFAPDVTDSSYVAHLAVIEVEHRDALHGFLREQGIGTDIHYPIPDHRQKVWQGKYAGLNLPNTEMAAARVLSLPCFPDLSEDELNKVITTVNNWED